MSLILLFPVGGKYVDSRRVFMANTGTNFHRCRLSYKPDYFFEQFQDETDQLVDLIRNNPQEFSDFPWNTFFTLDINQRIQIQQQFFRLILTCRNNPKKPSKTQITCELATTQSHLSNIVAQYRQSNDEKPWLVYFQPKHNSLARDFVWLITKSDHHHHHQSTIFKLDQQYFELFYFINCHLSFHLYFNHENLNIYLNESIECESLPVQQKLNPMKTKIDETDGIYRGQKLVGEQIFERIRQKMFDENKEFNRFEFYLVLPSRKSLQSQSLARMRKLLSDDEIKYLCNGNSNIESVIYPVNPAYKKKYIENVLNKATDPNNAQTMFLIIQDECHWGMNRDNQADTTFINHETLLDNDHSQNVYILHVSATPFNIEAIQHFEQTNIIRWDDVIPNNSPTNHYQGQHKLIHRRKIQSQSVKSKDALNHFEEFYSTFSYLTANRFDHQISLADLSLSAEYILTLFYLLISDQQKRNFSQKRLFEFVTDETWQILRNLFEIQTNGKGCLTVLRMKTVRTAQFLRDSMMKLLEIYNRSNIFDIVVDVDDDKQSLFDRLAPFSQIKYQIWWNHGQPLTKQQKENLTYEDLRYLPLLLIVIDKGRMGDTFPAESFKFFDLRARYQSTNANKSTNSCSLLQDVGRAFGYPTEENDRPTVFLGENILQAMNDDQLRPHQTLSKEPNQQNWIPNKDHPFGPNQQTNRQQKHQQVARRRFLLSAHPQIGKTGSFIWTVKLFIQMFNQLEQTIQIIEQLIRIYFQNQRITIIDMNCGQDKIDQHFRTNPNLTIINMKDLTLEHTQSQIFVFSLFLAKIQADDIDKYLQKAADLLQINGYLIIFDETNAKNFIVEKLNQTELFYYRKSKEKSNSNYFSILAQRKEFIDL